MCDPIGSMGPHWKVRMVRPGGPLMIWGSKQLCDHGQLLRGLGHLGIDQVQGLPCQSRVQRLGRGLGRIFISICKKDILTMMCLTSCKRYIRIAYHMSGLSDIQIMFRVAWHIRCWQSISYMHCTSYYTVGW